MIRCGSPAGQSRQQKVPISPSRVPDGSRGPADGTRPPAGDRPGDDQHPRRRLRPPAPAGRPGAGRGPADLPASRAGSSTTRRPSSARSGRWSRRRWPRRGSGPTGSRPIGLTNQRETTVLWDRADRPGDRPGDRLAGPPHGRLLRARTATAAPGSPSGPGLVLDPYFSATKIAWLLDHVPDARAPRRGRRARRRDRRQPPDLAPDRGQAARHRRRRTPRGPC